jgi:hypothetical protein
MWRALLGVALVIGAQLAFALQGTSGLVVLAGDDPYIHLDLADQLWRTGLYGVNEGIVTSPSSSIIWPFLLAPFSATSYPVELTLALAVLGSLAATAILYRLSRLLLQPAAPKWQALLLTGFFALLFNLPGLALMGLEHSWQLFLTFLGIYGVLRTIEGTPPPWWLWAALIAAPLFRYENVITSTALLGLLIWKGHIRQSLLSWFLMLVPLTLFSLFLIHLGLEPLPGSTLIKKRLLSEGAAPYLGELVAIGAHNPVGLFVGLLVPITGLISLAQFRQWRRIEWAILASIFVTAALHLLLGRLSGINAPRYEYYVVAYGLFLLLWLTKQNPPRPLIARLGLLLLFPLVLPAAYFSLYDAPRFMRCIYSQQYQMARLVRDYWQAPVAVNDIGLVGYRNPSFVLDLVGLADNEVRRLRLYDKDPDYAAKSVTARNIDLIMIFPDWFPRRTLRQWTVVGTLTCAPCADTISNGATSVLFLTPHAEKRQYLQERLRPWTESLPRGITFRMIDPASPVP